MGRPAVAYPDPIRPGTPRELIEKEPEMVRRFVTALAKASDRCVAHKEETSEITGKQIEFGPWIAAVTQTMSFESNIDRALRRHFQALDRYLVARGAIDGPIDRSRFRCAKLLLEIEPLLPVGALADRRGEAAVLAGTLCALAAGVALVAFGTLPVAVAGCALLGLGLAGWMLPLGLLRRVSPPDPIGWRTAVYRAGVDGGMFLGPLLAGLPGGHASATVAAIIGAASLLAIGVWWASAARAPLIAASRGSTSAR